MNRIIVLSAAFAGLVGGVMSYDAIQSPLFEKYQSWVEKYSIEIRDNDHYRNVFDKWQENHKYIEEINSKNLTYKLLS